MPVDLPPFFKFLSACLPGDQIIPSYFGILECLSYDGPGKVKSLEKNAALSIVHSAIEDVRNNAKLETIVLESNIQSFAPLIFGDSATIRQFIIFNTPCSQRLEITVDSTELVMGLEHSNILTQEHERNQPPVEKIMEIMDCVLVRASEANVLVNQDIQDASGFVVELVRTARRRDYQLVPGNGMFVRNRFIYVRIHKP